jgi:DNA-binding MarR family transcriptional regulator
MRRRPKLYKLTPKQKAKCARHIADLVRYEIDECDKPLGSDEWPHEFARLLGLPMDEDGDFEDFWYDEVRSIVHQCLDTMIEASAKE